MGVDIAMQIAIHPVPHTSTVNHFVAPSLRGRTTRSELVIVVGVVDVAWRLVPFTVVPVVVDIPVGKVKLNAAECVKVVAASG